MRLLDKILLPLLVTIVLPLQSWADEPSLAKPEAPEAQQHFVKGNRLYRVREFKAALEEFKAGAVIESAPVWDWNMGQCYRMLELYREAIWHYERFLRNGRPSAELEGKIRALIEQMNSELTKKAMTQPPTELDAGPNMSDTAAPESVVALEHGRSSLRWYQDPLGWSLLAGGVVVGGVSGALLYSSARLGRDADNTPDEDRRSDLRATGRTRGIAGTALAVGAGTSIVFGVLRLATHTNGRSRSRAGVASLSLSRRCVAVNGWF